MTGAYTSGSAYCRRKRKRLSVATEDASSCPLAEICPRWREYSSSRIRWLRGSARRPGAVNTWVMVALASSSTTSPMTASDTRRIDVFIRGRSVPCGPPRAGRRAMRKRVDSVAGVRYVKCAAGWRAARSWR
ncbi:Uncharacterised protein [Mycobacteroides abscessus subsp. abscessus]|nr:Uncharacterised protein [Mycobacteroides abscessus subsp. abscessus]